MSIPTHLGSYSVERELGRGGMGVVYLGRDPRLDRPVAIKVVPEVLALNPDNLARFEREARLLAAVSHPNIASIYGVEEAGGQRLLVMEYVPGETLAERIARGPLPVDETLDIGRQIASAIETAHEGGIIHRDLKPGNVKIAPDGTVKVLDFGLAKGGAASSSDLAQSPTLTYSPTAVGVILGTAGYMSPEQARGKPVDRRADIWAFACVLFECLTGRKVFEGETVSDTIARIIEREPPWDALPAATPPRIVELMRRCLEKDLKKRQRDIGDVRIEIEEALASRSSASRTALPTPAPESRAAPGRRLAMAGLLLAVSAAVGIGVWTLVARPPRSDAGPASLSVQMPASIRPTSARFAYEGDMLLVVGFPKRPDGTEDPKARIFARRLGSFDFTPIPGTEGAQFYTRSPDGRWLAVVVPIGDGVERRIVKVPIDGSSPPVPLANWSDDWSDLYWLDDGDLLITIFRKGKLVRLPTTGGGPGPEVSVDLGGRAIGVFNIAVQLPGRLGVLVLAETYGPRGYQQNIWNLDPATGKAQLFLENADRPQYLSSTGHVLFSRQSVLMAMAVDRTTGLPRGEQVALFDGLRTNSWSNGRFSVSAAGHLAFEPGGRVGADRRIVTVSPANEVTLFVADARPFEMDLNLSPDGRQVAVVIANSRSTWEVWSAASDRPGVRRTIALPVGDAFAAFWSPDQAWLAFSSYGGGADDGIYLQRADGSDAARSVLKVESAEQVLLLSGWTADGRGLLVSRFVDGRSDILVVPVSAAGEAEAARPLRATPATEMDALMSPDGRLLAFESDESGRLEMYVSLVANGAITGQPLVVSNGGADRARWSRDSRTLYMRDVQGRVVVVTVETTPAFRASPPRVMQDLRALRLDYSAWDVLPDGRLIGIQRGIGEDEVTSYQVVLNWLDSVRSRLPAR